MTTLDYCLRLMAGSVLALVSTAALVLALAGLVQPGKEQIMAMAAGISLQACLYLFARNKADRWISALLLAVSVAATVAFMEYAWQQQQAATVMQQQQRNTSSYRAQQLQRQIDDISQQISIRLQVSQRDTEGSYRSRGLSQLNDDIPRLTEQRETLLQQLATLTTDTTAPTGSMEAALGSAHWGFRVGVFIALALLLDYCAIRCLATVKPERKKQEVIKEGREPSAEAAKPEPALEPEITCENRPEPTVTEADPEVKRIAERVRSGSYGQQPIVRQIISEEGVRHPVVKQAFALLKAEGVLVKNGQRYELQEAA
ncbi:hypothetical protein [Endozoicomonas sp. YOMI1]|uniref:hypothetical protein n=1 Tax=Endozoicomonas sp. YOMI1 TaxID=2828739 RepID=UPI00214888BA|nr:hypothetical protein [Endozoicomonas sp. YOMI1]